MEAQQNHPHAGALATFMVVISPLVLIYAAAALVVRNRIVRNWKFLLILLILAMNVIRGSGV